MPGKIELTEEQKEQLEKLAGYGLNQEQISDFLGLSKRNLSLKLHDDEELLARYKRGKSTATAAVARSLFQMATNGRNVAATCFWLKCQGRWQETPQQVNHEHSGNINFWQAVRNESAGALPQGPGVVPEERPADQPVEGSA